MADIPVTPRKRSPVGLIVTLLLVLLLAALAYWYLTRENPDAVEDARDAVEDATGALRVPAVPRA